MIEKWHTVGKSTSIKVSLLIINAFIILGLNCVVVETREGKRMMWCLKNTIYISCDVGQAARMA